MGEYGASLLGKIFLLTTGVTVLVLYNFFPDQRDRFLRNSNIQDLYRWYGYRYLLHAREAFKGLYVYLINLLNTSVLFSGGNLVKSLCL
jgi:hypothetical protein